MYTLVSEFVSGKNIFIKYVLIIIFYFNRDP